MDTKTLKMKSKIAVIGSSRLEEVDQKIQKKAIQTGRLIAESGSILLTGGGHGIPYEAVKGAKEKEGITIGISPASNLEEHVRKFKMPIENFDSLIFTGFGYKGRNVVLVRSCDVVVAIDGGPGTLEELIIAFDEDKDIGLIEGSGGTLDCFQEMLKRSKRKHNGRIICLAKPEELIRRLIPKRLSE